jgi:hypothetical protein
MQLVKGYSLLKRPAHTHAPSPDHASFRTVWDRDVDFRSVLMLYPRSIGGLPAGRTVARLAVIY